jgi:hypothetical protein
VNKCGLHHCKSDLILGPCGLQSGEMEDRRRGGPYRGPPRRRLAMAPCSAGNVFLMFYGYTFPEHIGLQSGVKAWIIELLCQTQYAVKQGYVGPCDAVKCIPQYCQWLPNIEYDISSMNVSRSATFAFCVECMRKSILNENAHVKAASTVSQPATSFER